MKVNCKKFGYIGATPLIFNGTIRENVLYGNDDNVSDEARNELRLLIPLKRKVVMILTE